MTHMKPRRSIRLFRQFTLLVLAMCMLLSVSCIRAYAYENTNEETFAFRGQKLGVADAVLYLYQKKASGTLTDKPIGGATFQLYKGTVGSGTAVGDPLVTDSMGRIVADDLTIGNYYFQETKAPDGYTFDLGGSKTQYAFTVDETVLQREVVTLPPAYNRVLGAHAYDGAEELVFEFTGASFGKADAVLTLYEKDADGTESENILVGVKMDLYAGVPGAGTLVGETLTTDVNGQIVVDDLVLGDYYFETMAGVQYSFTITDTEAIAGFISVKAFDLTVYGQAMLAVKEAETDGSFEAFEKAINFVDALVTKNDKDCTEEQKDALLLRLNNIVEDYVWDAENHPDELDKAETARKFAEALLEKVDVEDASEHAGPDTPNGKYDRGEFLVRIQIVEDALKTVNKVVAKPSVEPFEMAEKYLGKLPDSSGRTTLQTLLDNLVTKFMEELLDAYDENPGTAEVADLFRLVQGMVYHLPEGSTLKDTSQDQLNDIVEFFVERAEERTATSDLMVAQGYVTLLPPGEVRQDFQDRLDKIEPDDPNETETTETDVPLTGSTTVPSEITGQVKASSTVPITINQEPVMLDVEVPTLFAMQADKNGEITAGIQEYQIQNYSMAQIKIHEFKLNQSDDDWKMIPIEDQKEDLADKKYNTRNFALGVKFAGKYLALDGYPVDKDFDGTPDREIDYSTTADDPKDFLKALSEGDFVGHVIGRSTDGTSATTDKSIKFNFATPITKQTKGATYTAGSFDVLFDWNYATE